MPQIELPQLLELAPLELILLSSEGVILAANQLARENFATLPLSHSQRASVDSTSLTELLVPGDDLLLRRTLNEISAPFRTLAARHDAESVAHLSKTFRSVTDLDAADLSGAVTSIEVRMRGEYRNSSKSRIFGEFHNSFETPVSAGNDSPFEEHFRWLRLEIRPVLHQALPLDLASVVFTIVVLDITEHKLQVMDLKQRNEKLALEVAKISRKRREDARQARLNYEVVCEQIELARKEKELADSLNARWRSLTEHAPQIVMLLDQLGKVLFCNRRIGGLHLPDREVPDRDVSATSTNHSVQDFISAHDPLLTRRVVDEVLRTQISKAYELEGTDDSAQPIWHSISVGPVLSQRGELSTSIILIATDITQRKLAEQAIANHQEELAHVSRLASMGALTVELAHELNQPLGVIGFYVGGCMLEMQRDDFDVEKVAMAHQRILSETQRAGQITDSILDFLRRREAPRLMTDIDWLIRQTLPLVELESQKHNVPITCQLHAGKSDVNVNRVQIQQIIINLVSNAIHSVAAAEPKKPTVCIATRAVETGGIEVSISDNGAGFDSKTAEQLFQPLYTTKDKGTGMGLSICRTLVELHGGRISAVSRPNSGATFTFNLPDFDSNSHGPQSRSAYNLAEFSRP